MPTALFAEFDAALDGQLARLIKRWRKEGMSDQGIVLTLHEDYDLTTTKGTISVWRQKLGIE